MHTYTIIPLILGVVQSTYTNTESTCMSIYLHTTKVCAKRFHHYTSEVVVVRGNVV